MLYAAMSTNVSTTDIVITAANAASVLVCLFAAILVFAFKLYKLVVYRLALYQVLSGLAFALVGTLKIIVVKSTTAKTRMSTIECVSPLDG